MPIEEIDPIKLKSFFSDRRGHDRQQSLNLLSSTAEKKEILEFTMLWGASDKRHATKSDKDCLLYLFSFFKQVSIVYNVSCKLTIIFADTHAYLNGYNPWDFNRYWDEIRYSLKKHKFSWKISSFIVRDRVNEFGFNTIPGYLDNVVINSDALFETIVNRIPNLEVLNNFEHYAKRHCNRIGGHPRGIFFKNALSAAKAYIYFTLIEAEIIAEQFPNSIFLTYTSKEEEFILPKLPALRLYSVKSGLRSRPWFSNK